MASDPPATMIQWCWTGDHGALENRRQDRNKAAAGANDAAAPAFANVALVAGSTGIVGAALVDMLRSLDTPAGPWKVYALCRRARPASSSSSAASTPGAVVNIQVDLADAAAVAAALAPFTDVTHVFYAAWSPRRGSANDDAEAHEANRGMLRNLLSAVVPNRPGLAHVCLLASGRDHQFVDPFDPVTGTPSAMRPCYSEDLLRLEYPNLEDVLLVDLPRLVAHGGARVTWSAHRLATVFGFSPRRGGKNVVAGLCVYAAVCRKEGVALRWPGSLVAWEGFSDASDAELVAEHALWATLELSGRNEVFNCTNGDVFKWKQLWPALAKQFEVEWSGYEGEHRRFKLEEAMARKEAVWAEIVGENGLVETKLDDITAWWYVDAVINADKEKVDTMNKSKERGFLGFRNTVRSFDAWIGKMKASRIVP